MRKRAYNVRGIEWCDGTGGLCNRRIGVRVRVRCAVRVKFECVHDRVTVMAHEGFEGQLRAQINEEFKGYKAVVKVLWRHQYRRAIRTVNTLLDDET